jgi:hypothetical protein
VIQLHDSSFVGELVRKVPWAREAKAIWDLEEKVVLVVRVHAGNVKEEHYR